MRPLLFPTRTPTPTPTLALALALALTRCVRYYYRGCADWRWHYDQHYAPFAHDLATHCAAWCPSPWSEAGPLRPLEQLVTVLPAQSAALLPEGYRPLLCSDESPLTQWCPASVLGLRLGLANPHPHPHLSPSPSPSPNPN